MSMKTVKMNNRPFLAHSFLQLLQCPKEHSPSASSLGHVWLLSLLSSSFLPWHIHNLPSNLLVPIYANSLDQSCTGLAVAFYIKRLLIAKRVLCNSHAMSVILDRTNPCLTATFNTLQHNKHIPICLSFSSLLWSKKAIANLLMKVGLNQFSTIIWLEFYPETYYSGTKSCKHFW